MAENLKGQPGGECGRLLCKCHPATWYDAINEMNVCQGCAGDINRLYRALSVMEPCTEVATLPIVVAIEPELCPWDTVLP